MSRPTTSEDRAFYYPDKRLADDDHRRMFEADAAVIERDAAAYRRLSILAAHPEREDSGDKLLRYLEREKARRKRYLSNHLSIDTITVRRAKP